MSTRMRRSALLLASVLGLLFPAEARPQTTGFTTKAIKEFSNALTNAGRFGVPRYATASLPTCAATNRGAVAFDTSTLSLKVCSGSAWAVVGGGGAASITMNDDVPLAFGTAADNTRPAILFNTTETVDTGMFLTGTVSNHWVIAENQDKTFDFAHAAATDPTLFIHSHNQSTTEWTGLFHNATRGVITTGTGTGLVLNSGVTTAVGGFVVGAGLARFGSANAIAWSSTTDATAAADTATRRLAAGVITQTGATATSIGSLLGGGANVASADPLPVPTGIVFHVTGTTNFTNITTTNMVTGACFTMIFDGALTITDGGNLKLSANYTTTADDTLTVCFDGTNYYEVARAVN